MTRKKQTKEDSRESKTNGFPLNGSFPGWIKDIECNKCSRKINFNEYLEVGFFLKGQKEKKLFVRFRCDSCENIFTKIFGDDEEFTLERLCTLVIQHSNVLKLSEKILWERTHNPRDRGK